MPRLCGMDRAIEAAPLRRRTIAVGMVSLQRWEGTSFAYDYIDVTVPSPAALAVVR